jgi:hypothetical protein
LEYIRGEKSHVAPLIAIQEGNCDWQGSALWQVQSSQSSWRMFGRTFCCGAMLIKTRETNRITMQRQRWFCSRDWLVGHTSWLIAPWFCAPSNHLSTLSTRTSTQSEWTKRFPWKSHSLLSYVDSFRNQNLNTNPPLSLFLFLMSRFFILFPLEGRWRKKILYWTWTLFSWVRIASTFAHALLENPVSKKITTIYVMIYLFFVFRLQTTVHLVQRHVLFWKCYPNGKDKWYSFVLPSLHFCLSVCRAVSTHPFICLYSNFFFGNNLNCF